MSTPVIICDDSSFARKQVARALPDGWDIDITYATHGEEAVAAIKEGKGDIILLDLTMPIMDGFGVLEYIRKSDSPTLPIVISGDIQPDSYQRVMSLGAVAFIKKPINPEELISILNDYGLLEVLTQQAHVEVEAGINFLEWCQEIANVAMGQAADLLVAVIGERVELPIPHVSLLERSELQMALSSTGSANGYSCITQGFIGGGISGENLLFFYDADTHSIAELMGRPGESLKESEEGELYMDIANILIGAFLKGYAEQLDVHFSQGHPRIMVHTKEDELKLRESSDSDGPILTIEINYVIGENQFSCTHLLLITPGSVSALKVRSGEEIIE